MPERTAGRDRPTTPTGPRHGSGVDGSARTERVEAPGSGRRARTSVAAVFSLVFGLLGALAAPTGLLAPVAVLFGVVGLVLAVVGMRAGRKPLTTGRGVAIGGLVLSLVALVLGIAALVGLASVVSDNPQILDRITGFLTEVRARIPGA